MFILKRLFADDIWSLYECPLSRKVRFDSYAANYKCRRIVADRVADEAQVMDEQGAAVALWQWSETAKEPRKVFGPDL